MDGHGMRIKEVIKRYSSDENNGLTSETVEKNGALYGRNVITEKKKQTLFKRIVKALFEPMMIILLFGLVITLGVNIGKALKDGSGSFYECVGIAIAIGISVTLTVVMEGKSEKAFAFLKAMGDNVAVKVVRDGQTKFVNPSELVVGDIVVNQAGDKIFADGRIIECSHLKTDESSLTGESKAVAKNAADDVCENTPLAERKNVVFSGTYVAEGSVKYIVTAVGDAAEIGKVAGFVDEEKTVSAPLKEKLDRLGKFVSIFGLICALFVLVLSVVRLFLTGNLTFDSVENVFIESIVLIVAAVPEGLPATVAISLSLNVVRLAKSNALIKKLVATETVGCVSVICSDKTGTLTQNKMLVETLFTPAGSYGENRFTDKYVSLNCAINSTADYDGEKVYGSATEGAFLIAMAKSGIDYKKIRSGARIISSQPFDSSKKMMETTAAVDGKVMTFIKGAPEKILPLCVADKKTADKIYSLIEKGQSEGKRALAFCHTEDGRTVYDGFCLIGDKLRKGIEKSVKNCLAAGVKVKILTGDGQGTAAAIAGKLGLDSGEENVITADKLEKMTDDEIKRVLTHVTVIARSTPSTKLKVVKLLREMGEVVAVTGDGVNDAPAIKHADIGICMGGGSEITKQASDIVLLDDCFDTILTAISFGRNIFDNFQRFITFQLNVNCASIAIILTYLVIGLESPFSSMCLLWLNVIMDGPLALSLSLESRPLDLTERKPVKRNSDILSKRMLSRIAVHSFFMCFIITMQELYNFLGVTAAEKNTVTITMFVFFQLFNAINCREVRSASALKGIFDNKLLVIMLGVTFALHILIVSFIPDFFGTVRLSPLLWAKITLICSSVLAFSELYKWSYRAFGGTLNAKIAKFTIMKRRKVT